MVTKLIRTPITPDIMRANKINIFIIWLDSNIEFHLAGRNRARTFPPSRGCRGIILNTARRILIIPNARSMVIMICALSPAVWLRSIREMILMKARSIFERGPAAAIQNISLTTLFKFLVLTGTGLAQPKINGIPVVKPMSGSTRVPMGSIWGMGLRVSLPIRAAVLSPLLRASQPWANSWKQRANRKGGKRTATLTMAPSRLNSN